MAGQFIQEKILISMIFIIVGFIKKPVYKNSPLSNRLIKINYFVHRELLTASYCLFNA